MDFLSFGLTSVKKEDLFLSEIDFLTERKHWSYWDVYGLPVPTRKWFIKQILDRDAKSKSNAPSNDEPLTPVQKQQMIAKAQMASNNPGPPPGMFNAIRNIK